MMKRINAKQPILSGVQPNGVLHIGNYLGALVQFVELQKKYDCYFMIADLHALTANPDPKELHKQTLDVIRVYIAAGIDPKKSTIFIQSHVREHAELTWILSNYTSIGELERMTQFKEKSERQSLVNAGLFTYPVLMAADILLYQAGSVPVGDDQIQHLELTRTIARRFNNRYKTIFTEPKLLLAKQARVMALNDPTKKMSKSIPGSYIALTDSPEIIRQKIMSAVTDNKPGHAMSAGVANLFGLADFFLSKEDVDRLRKQFYSGTLHYRELKEQLAEGIINHLAPVQERMRALSDHELVDIARKGAKRAQAIATETLKRTKEVVGLLA